MKKVYIFLIIAGVILSVLAIGGFVLAKTELTTYVANLRLEATSGYPPHLTIMSEKGITKETALASIMPSLSFRGLSLTEPHVFISGNIEIDCGGDYQETREFYLSTNNPGDRMEQTFTYKDIPPKSVCYLIAQPLECQSQLTPSMCLKTRITYVFRTPN